MRHIQGALLAIPLVAYASGVSAANLIKDGGFETPAVPSGSYTDYYPGQQMGAWTIVGAHNVALTSTTSVNTGVTTTAKKGLAFADLTGDCDCGDPTEGVAQTVNTSPGTTYTLTFWVGNCYIPTRGTTSTVNVYLGSTLLIAAYNAKGEGINHQVWKKFKASFVATATTTTISFLNGDQYGDSQDGVDQVSLVAD